MAQGWTAVPGHAPWPRLAVTAEAWRALAEALGRGEGDLVALFGDTEAVHMALRGPLVAEAGGRAVVTCAVEGGRFPSVGLHHAPAIRLERAVRDLFGHIPRDAPDARAWLDHGAWATGTPLALVPGWPQPKRYAFLPVVGERLHEIPVGPVHAGIIEPGHFRFTAHGEHVVRLEARLGYVHKGIEALAIGAPVERAVKLAGRLSGDSTVAGALAAARAIEAALAVTVPQRAHVIRAAMAELERLANHLGDFGAVCNDAAFALIHTHCGLLREAVLRACERAFGHRLMMDKVIPGGVAGDLAREGVARLREMLAEIAPRFEELVALYDSTPSLLDRTVATGILERRHAVRFAAGGVVGRASGRDFDARRDEVYPPYDLYAPKVAVREAGDVDARLWVRIEEAREAMRLVRVLVDNLMPGPVAAEVRPAGEVREGLALVEGFRGEVFAWVRLGAEGRVQRLHLRDPSWFQWPLLEAAIEGNIVADFPLCNKSFNCSYSGVDL